MVGAADVSRKIATPQTADEGEKKHAGKGEIDDLRGK